MLQYRENVLDGNTLNFLRKSVGWRPFSEEQARAAVKHSLYTVEVLDGDVPVGMGRVIGDCAAYFLLVDVVVQPEYQARGIGRVIISRMLDDVRQTMQKGNLPRVSVNLVAAHGKEGFYEKLGFHDIRREKTGTGMQIFLSR